MGPMNSMLNYLGFGIAMEAEDITKEAEAETNDVVGSDGEGEKTDGEIDLNTDDILGTANTDDDPTNDTNSDDNNESESGSDETDEENNEDEETEGSNTESEDIPEQNEPENEFASDRKAKLRKQFLYFYDLLSDSYKLISEFMPNVTEESTIQTLSSINKNMLQCKEEIYNILTDEFVDTEYHELLKKYISLNHIYDLCINTLDKFFASIKKDEKK